MKILLVFLATFFSFSLHSAENVNTPIPLLIQIDCRCPVEELPKIVKGYIDNLSGEIPYNIQLFYDLKDLNSHLEIKAELDKIPHLTFYENEKKPNQFNQAVAPLKDNFEWLFITSDKFLPAEKNFDKAIFKILAESPKNDVVLNLTREGIDEINSSPVIGNKFYKQFGYAVNPVYEQSHYDKELTFTSRILAKEIPGPQTLLKSINSSPLASNAKDEQLFQERRFKGFDITDAMLKEIFKKDWSILILTLDEREKSFSKLYNALQQQIKENNLEDRVEILVFKDNRENTIGFKRNDLLRRSRGMYVNYIDDDDDLHPKYVKMIHDRISKKPDCVSLVGVITFDGKSPQIFIHSIKYNTYFQKDNIYYRPPNHISTIKRAIAAQFLFPAISFGEDTDWAMRIAKTGLIRSEEEISEPYYFYKYIQNKR